jgi:hypothetical protein
VRYGRAGQSEGVDLAGRDEVGTPVMHAKAGHVTHLTRKSA